MLPYLRQKKKHQESPLANFNNRHSFVRSLTRFQYILTHDNGQLACRELKF